MSVIDAFGQGPDPDPLLRGDRRIISVKSLLLLWSMFSFVGAKLISQKIQVDTLWTSEEQTLGLNYRLLLDVDGSRNIASHSMNTQRL